MKAVQKLAVMMMGFIMALAMAVPAFAAGTTYTITITNDKAGHTYEAYQVFAGDLSGGVLSNITWGTGVKGDALLAALKADTTIGSSFTDCDSAAKVAEVLTSFGNNSTNLDAFAAVVGKHLSTATGTSAAGTGSYTISGLSAGYYFVKDQGKSVTGNDAYTKFMLKLVEDTTVTPKSDVPTSEKKVKDTEDSAGTESGWQDSADWDIDDKVPFQLTGTVASNYADYETYRFIFHDEQSTGLTFDASSVHVYVDGTEITNPGQGDPYFTVVTSGLDADCTFEVRFADLKNITSVHAGSVITVEYESILNEQAVIGSAGNPNTMHLEFSNNPNDEQGGDTGTTPDDTVIVFTYKTIVNKVRPAGDGETGNQPLTGAAFKLEKFVANANGSETSNDVKGTWKLVKDYTGEGAKTSFEFTGLDDGVYRLTETVTPAGYNSIDPIIFTVTANHDIKSDNPSLTSLNGNAASGGITFTANNNDASLTTDVLNRSGTTLPETGGMGTTVFYIVGGALVVGAGVLLVTKKRMGHRAH